MPGSMRPGRWPPWAYGAMGAGYTLAAGFSAIYVAPWFMGPLELEPERDEAPLRGGAAAAEGGAGAMPPQVAAHREARRPELARIAAVASAVAKSPTIDGTATYSAVPPPAAHDSSTSAGAGAEGDVAAAQQAPACEAAPQAAGVSAADGASERDLTYEEVRYGCAPGGGWLVLCCASCTGRCALIDHIANGSRWCLS